jgi:ADP-heptose:LPS heptosyltransferase
MPRVLIIKPSSLGDIVHGLQVAQSLRAQWPAAEVDWVAAKAFAPLVEACTAVHGVRLFERHGPLTAFGRLAGEIRRDSYDWALDMQGLARSALLLAASKARQKAGRADAREGARWLYRLKPELPPDGRYSHALDILLNFLPLMGLRAKLAGPLVFRPPVLDVYPAGLLESRPVVMFPDSRRPKKEWGGFYDLTARLLAQRPDLPIVWAGNTGPEPDLHWPLDRFWNLLGRTPLETLPALLTAARLVVCNDSGPMHLAAALQRPVVALFGPTNPNRFGPYPLDSKRHFIVRAPEGKMNRIEVDYVYEVVAGAARK